MYILFVSNDVIYSIHIAINISVRNSDLFVPCGGSIPFVSFMLLFKIKKEIIYVLVHTFE